FLASFLSSFVVTLVLLSFPTRRSSDLTIHYNLWFITNLRNLGGFKPLTWVFLYGWCILCVFTNCNTYSKFLAGFNCSTNHCRILGSSGGAFIAPPHL